MQSIFAVVLGNTLEFYDFTIYVAFAPILARAFFPMRDPMTGLLLSVSTYGIGFVVRPLGGMLLGAYSDRYGRKPVMTLTIGLMAFASGIIGLLPTYRQIGVAAPLLLVFARLVQGFSVGGEFAPSTIFLTETAPSGREYFFASFQAASQAAAAVLSGTVGILIAVLLPQASVEQWGWRIPFLIGILIAPFGIYIRQRLHETLPCNSRHASISSILSTLMRQEWLPTVLGILIVAGITVTQYFCLYAATYAIVVLKYSQQMAMTVNFTVGAVGVVFSLIGGWLADRLGAMRLALLPRLALVALLYPSLSIASSSGSPLLFLAVIAGLMALHAIGATAQGLLILKAFPISLRGTGFAISTALGISLFGGTAQILFTWMIAATGDKLSFVWYVVAINVVTIASISLLRYFDRRPFAHRRPEDMTSRLIF